MKTTRISVLLVSVLAVACGSSVDSGSELTGDQNESALSTSASALTITSPTANSNVSGKITVTGTAGSQWLNVAAFYPNGGMAKIGNDVTPSRGTFSLTVDTTLLPNGSNTIAIIAFSVRAGASGGTQKTVNLTLKVNNSPTPPTPPAPPTPDPTPPAPDPTPAPDTSALTITSPTANSNVSGKITVTGTAGSQWVNVGAFDPNDGMAKLSTDVTPSQGTFSLTVDTSLLPDGANTIAIIAFSVPAGGLGGTQKEVDLTLNVSNMVTPPPPPPPPPPPVDTVGVSAVSANDFLSSTGVNTHISQGYNWNGYIAPLKYLGVRNIRDGWGNLSNAISVHQQTGVMVDLLIDNNNCNSATMVSYAKQLVQAGALLSVEGPNEPNNFPVMYNGQKGGTTTATWKPVAQCQQDLYSAVKNDATLKNYPVFTVSETGAQFDNVGLQWLTIPSGASTTMPVGTQYADYANVHNYVSSNNTKLYQNNMAWDAADNGNTSTWPGDGLYGNFGSTWLKKFQGYTISQLATLPKVTTETGWDSVNGTGGERVQGIVLVNTYLSQFKRGWRYTFIYELMDGEGSDGYQGLYKAGYTAKLAADYIHNLTTILADNTSIASPAKLNYSIANQPATVHDLLLQKSNGAFELVVWGEQPSGTNNVVVNLGSSRQTVNVYDVTSGTTPTQKLTNVSSVTLPVTDHALIIEVIN